MKKILIYICIPFYSFAQVSINDSTELSKIGVWNPKDYPNFGIHSFWIDCENPLLFVNEKIDFKQIEYKIIGGTFIKGEKNNQISLIPFETNIKVNLIYKATYSQTFEFRARKLPSPSFELTKMNGDTLKNTVKLTQLDNFKIIPSTHIGLVNDLVHRPSYIIDSYKFLLTRKNELNNNILIGTGKGVKQLKKITKKAKKNDMLSIEVTFLSSRYSFLSKNKIIEKSTFLQSYKVE